MLGPQIPSKVMSRWGRQGSSGGERKAARARHRTASRATAGSPLAPVPSRRLCRRPDARRCPDDTRRAQPNRWPSGMAESSLCELRGKTARPERQAAIPRVSCWLCHPNSPGAAISKPAKTAGQPMVAGTASSVVPFTRRKNVLTWRLGNPRRLPRCDSA